MFCYSFHSHDEFIKNDFWNLIDCLEIKLEDDERIFRDFLEIAEGKKRIFSCRSSNHGGTFHGNSKEQKSILKKAIQLKPDFLEVESGSDSCDLISEFPDTEFILSFADIVDLKDFFAKSPDYPNLKMIRFTPEATKWEDNLLIRELLSQGNGKYKVIGFCSGEKGLISRVMSGQWGGFITCVADKSSDSEFSFYDAFEKYRLPEISEHTLIYGIEGSPVKHSLSPDIHNYLLKEKGISGVYLPFDVDNFAEFNEFAKDIGISGLSVTTPHKERAYEFSKGRCELSQKVKSTNTLKFGSDHYDCRNTDGPGFTDALNKRMVIKDSVFLVIGAGGAGRPVISSLLDQGAGVYLTGRNQGKVMTTANQLGCSTLVGNEGKVRFDGVINTTPVAYSNEDITGFLIGLIPPRCLAIDFHYYPQKPYFLKEAEELGCKTMNGLDMLLCQALRQFEFWHPDSGKNGFEKLKSFVLEEADC